MPCVSPSGTSCFVSPPVSIRPPTRGTAWPGANSSLEGRESRRLQRDRRISPPLSRSALPYSMALSFTLLSLQCAVSAPQRDTLSKLFANARFSSNKAVQRRKCGSDCESLQLLRGGHCGPARGHHRPHRAPPLWRTPKRSSTAQNSAKQLAQRSPSARLNRTVRSLTAGLDGRPTLRPPSCSSERGSSADDFDDIPETVDFRWIARQLIALQNDIASLRDDMTVTTAALNRLDDNMRRLNGNMSLIVTELRAMRSARGECQTCRFAPPWTSR